MLEILEEEIEALSQRIPSAAVAKVGESRPFFTYWRARTISWSMTLFGVRVILFPSTLASFYCGFCLSHSM